MKAPAPVSSESRVEPSPSAAPAEDRSLALLGRSPLRAIVSLGAPTTAVMLVATTSNVLHTYFVSRLGADAIAAVSLVFPISLIMITLMGAGLGTGVSSGIARALGARRNAGARAIAEHAIGLSIVLAVLLTVVLESGAERLFAAMGGTGPVLEQATLFARTLFGGLLLSFLVSTFDSIMRGEGNVRIPALCASLSLGLQIVLTPLYMFAAGLGLVGAPLATLTGQFLGGVPRVRHIFGGRGAVQPRFLPRALAWKPLAEILSVGVPASLSATLNYVALVVLTGTFGHIDDAHLAAYGLGTRLDFLLFSLGYGVAAATLTLVGMATGARRWDLVGQYVGKTVALVLALVALPAALVIWKPSLWFGIFTDEPGIHRVGATYFRVIGPSYFFAVTSMVLASAFQALGRATIPLAVMAARVLFVVAGAITLTRVLGLGATPVFAFIAGGNVLSCLLLLLIFRRTVGRFPVGT